VTNVSTHSTLLADRQRPLAPLALLGALVACFGVAAIGGMVTGSEIGGWYRTLEKPWFNPPDWVFSPVWTVLYLIMAAVLWQIWRTPVQTAAETALRRRAILAFAVQLALNLSWSLVFFGLNSIVGGMVVIVLLWLAIVWTIRAARPVIGRAVWWLAPYLAWVSFAALLNGAILVLNR
jgi:translocator protein